MTSKGSANIVRKASKKRNAALARVECQRPPRRTLCFDRFEGAIPSISGQCRRPDYRALLGHGRTRIARRLGDSERVSVHDGPAPE